MDRDERFADRAEAGVRLAAKLRGYQSREDCIVLGLPRGGIVVAYEIARLLELPLDACLVRKLGLPSQPELAMGAIAPGGIEVLNQDVIQGFGVSRGELELELADERAELARRDAVYRSGRPFPDVRGKTVILVDDGIATGATMEAGIQVLRHEGAERIVVAVGAAPNDTLWRLRQVADEIVCVLAPSPFGAISMWFDDFSQVSDEQVRALLSRAGEARAARAAAPGS